MVLHPCPFVGWLMCQQDYGKKFHETWMEDGSQLRTDPINAGVNQDRGTEICVNFLSY